MTLPPLMRALALEDDGSVEREVQLARAAVARAGLATRGAGPAARARSSPSSGGSMRRGFGGRRCAATVRRTTEPSGWRELGNVQRQAQAEERRTLSDLRARGVIGDDAFHRVEEELDWAEVNAQARAPRARVRRA